MMKLSTNYRDSLRRAGGLARAWRRRVAVYAVRDSWYASADHPKPWPRNGITVVTPRGDRTTISRTGPVSLVVLVKGVAAAPGVRTGDRVRDRDGWGTVVSVSAITVTVEYD